MHTLPFWKNNAVKMVAGMFAAAAALAFAPDAMAGCNPACPAGQICRYEAAGGHFYCAAPRGGRGGATRMQSRGRARSSTATNTNAPAPTAQPTPGPGGRGSR